MIHGKKIYRKKSELLSDTITPISVFLNLRDVYKSVSLFESSDYHSKENSKSFICVNPIVTLKVNNGELQQFENDNLKATTKFNSIEDLQNHTNDYDFVDTELQKYNGFFGYFSYDSIQYFESLKTKVKSKYQDVSEIYFSIFEYIIVFDNFSNRAQIIANSFIDELVDFRSILNNVYKYSLHQYQFKLTANESVSNTDNEFLENVVSAKENVKKGDVFQMVISRCFSQQYLGDDFQVYRELRALNPSPYMFYFDMEKAKVFGTSPEAQVKVTSGLAEIHPIAGTIKRSKDLEKDLRKTKELQANPKENAEHVMLVDLARNDLNRTCKNVKVTDYKKIQNFSHVIHMVSKVTGEVKNKNTLKTFAQSFPAGTLSGAPKYRAMELIQDYEKDNRGFYGGAIGQICPNGDLNMAIIIRSCLSQNNTLNYQAGAGVVLDSIPEMELKEVDNKIKAVRTAIQLATK
jgi:anthranilate synthase component 1